ncbi:AAA ATPase domain-containing protein [Asanoa hainanensis]|uniref:AAA ATPase domain-containing protein n=1 Tax=Asanoa hainanensis TaxID=560556 RepID=A0A239P8U6_9ACTN|nr:AAA family ATPase [Asanoa hainanensis]SNT63526.1 AAA ATPase domain-containing protein [Asanoa hainanensis]
MTNVDVGALKAVARGSGTILQAGRDVITGTVFNGGFARLRDVWLDPQPVFDEVQLDRFAGREWLISKVDDFVDRHDHGFVVVQGPAGVGKTAVAAWLAARRGWPCHFTRRAKGRSAATALRNLAAQIIAAYELSEQFAPGGGLPDTAAEPGWFEQVLRAGGERAAAAGQRLVIVVDGLDEAETFEGDLPLGLPARLPRNVVVVATCRTGSALPGLRLPWQVTTIKLGDRRNLDDMRRFLDRSVRADPQIADRLTIDPEVFIDRLLERCGGVWVYLRYVLDEVRFGLRSPDDLAALPADLSGYYTQALFPPGADDPIRSRVLSTLAAVAEPLPAPLLADLCGLGSPDVETLCEGPFRPFLTVTDDSRYGIYHLSLRDYLHGAATGPMLAADRHRSDRLGRATAAAHGAIADFYLALFGGLADGLPSLAGDLDLVDVHGGYARRNLAFHLERGGREDDLHRLLAVEARGACLWYAALDHVSASADFGTDLGRARALVAQRVDADLRAGRPSPHAGLDLRYAIIAAATYSLTVAIPFGLTVALVRHGLWGAERALAETERLRRSRDRVQQALLLLPVLTGAHRARAIALALASARSDEYAADRAQSLAEILESVDEPEEALVMEAMDAALHLDLSMRAEAIVRLAPLLPARCLRAAVEVALTLDDPGDRLWLSTSLARHVPEDELPRLVHAVGATPEDQLRAELIEAVAERSVPATLPDLLVAAHAIATSDDRGLALLSIAVGLSADVRDESLADVRATVDPSHRALALARSAASLDRADLVREAVAAALSCEPEMDALESLVNVACLTREVQGEDALADCLDRLATAEVRVEFIQALATVDGPPVDALLGLVDRITDERGRPSALAALGEVATGPAAKTIVELAAGQSDAIDRARVLGEVARNADAELAETLLAEVARLPEAYLRAHVVNNLADRLTGAQVGAALSLVQSITDEHGRARFLAAAATAETREVLLADALTEAERITFHQDRAMALVDILEAGGPSAPVGLVDELFGLTSRFLPDTLNTMCLERTRPWFSPEQWSTVFDIARTEARKPSHESTPAAWALYHLAALGPPARSPELLRASAGRARELRSGPYQSLLLMLIAARLPGEEGRTLLREAMDTVARADPGAPPLERFASLLVRVIPEAVLVRCLAAGHTLLRPDADPAVLEQVLRLLPAPVAQLGVDALAGVATPGERGLIFANTALLLREPAREAAVRHTLADPSFARGRSQLVSRATARAAGQLDAYAFGLLRRCLDDVDLDDCLSILSGATDLVRACGGEAAINDCLEAARTVRRWWPRLTDQPH